MPVWKCYVGKSWFSASCHVCWRECKIKDNKECWEDLRGTWTMKHNVSGRESLQRKTTSPGSCPSYRSAIMTTRCSLSHHRKTLDFEFPEHFLNCFYFGALCIFIHFAFYHLCHQCLRNIKSKQSVIKSGIKIHCCSFLDLTHVLSILHSNTLFYMTGSTYSNI